MDDVVGVEYLHTVENVPEYFEGLPLSKAMHLLDVGLKVASVTVFADKVKIFLRSIFSLLYGTLGWRAA